MSLDRQYYDDQDKLATERVPAVPLPDTNPKSAFGMKKPPMHLIPQTALVQLAGVMELGAKKYQPYNWRTSSVAATVYVSAALRHIAQYLDGENIDEESGESHISHAMACCAILLDAAATGNLIDDRPKPSNIGALIKERTKP